MNIYEMHILAGLREEIDALYRAWDECITTGNVGIIADIFCEDCRMMEPNAPVRFGIKG